MCRWRHWSNKRFSASKTWGGMFYACSLLNPGFVQDLISLPPLTITQLRAKIFRENERITPLIRQQGTREYRHFTYIMERFDECKSEIIEVEVVHFVVYSGQPPWDLPNTNICRADWQNSQDRMWPRRLHPTRLPFPCRSLLSRFTIIIWSRKGLFDTWWCACTPTSLVPIHIYRALHTKPCSTDADDADYPTP